MGTRGLRGQGMPVAEEMGDRGRHTTELLTPGEPVCQPRAHPHRGSLSGLALCSGLKATKEFLSSALPQAAALKNRGSFKGQHVPRHSRHQKK